MDPIKNDTTLYKYYRKIVYILLVLTFGTSIYFYNENLTLRRIIQTNTVLIDDASIDQTIREIQHYEATGEILRNRESKPLDNILRRVFKDHGVERTLECNQTTGECQEVNTTETKNFDSDISIDMTDENIPDSNTSINLSEFSVSVDYVGTNASDSNTTQVSQ